MTDSSTESVIARQIAQEHTTSSDTLEQLKDHKDLEVRRLVALNPNASKQTLFTLSKDYPDEVVENAAFNLLLLEDCDDLCVQLIVARSSTASAEQLTAFASSRQKTLLVAVGRNPNTPAHVLEKLILEPQLIDVREEVFRLDFSARQQCPDEFFDSYDDNYTIRSVRQKCQEEVLGAIASNPNFPIYLMGFFMHHLEKTRPIARYTGFQYPWS